MIRQWGYVRSLRPSHGKVTSEVSTRREAHEPDLRLGVEARNLSGGCGWGTSDGPESEW
jgi:hypothetical protein